MKAAPQILCTLLLLLVGGGSALRALERDDVLLYVPFEGRLTPELCATAPEIKFDKGGAEDVVYVEGRKGRGLQAGAGLSIRYVERGMFAKREGTIACWVRPLGWRQGDNRNHFFLNAYSDTALFMLYKYYPGNTWVYLAGGGKTSVVGGWCDPWEEGQWTFLAFAFRPGEQAWYVDGERQGRRTAELLAPEFAKTGILQVREGSHVIDEIMVFRRALAPPEIRALYEANRQ